MKVKDTLLMLRTMNYELSKSCHFNILKIEMIFAELNLY
jgi:hypothetical protein